MRLGPIEVAVVVDPALDIRVVRLSQTLQGLVAVMVKGPRAEGESDLQSTANLARPPPSCSHVRDLQSTANFSPFCSVSVSGSAGRRQPQLPLSSMFLGGRAFNPSEYMLAIRTYTDGQITS